jgi:hypothetical protein
LIVSSLIFSLAIFADPYKLYLITAIIRKFWWSGARVDNSTTSFHSRSWNICRQKKEGGLEVKDLLTINRSLSSCGSEHCHR